MLLPDWSHPNARDSGSISSRGSVLADQSTPGSTERAGRYGSLPDVALQAGGRRVRYGCTRWTSVDSPGPSRRRVCALLVSDPPIDAKICITSSSPRRSAARLAADQLTMFSVACRSCTRYLRPHFRLLNTTASPAHQHCRSQRLMVFSRELLQRPSGFQHFSMHRSFVSSRNDAC